MTRIVCHSPVAKCRALLCILCGALRVRNVLFHTINLDRCWPENSMGGLIAAFLPMPWLPSRRWRPKASCTETVSLRQPLQPPRCEKRILGIWSPYSCDLMDLVAARWIGGCGMVDAPVCQVQESSIPEQTPREVQRAKTQPTAVKKRIRESPCEEKVGPYNGPVFGAASSSQTAARGAKMRPRFFIFGSPDAADWAAPCGALARS